MSLSKEINCQLREQAIQAKLDIIALLALEVGKGVTIHDVESLKAEVKDLQSRLDKNVETAIRQLDDKNKLIASIQAERDKAIEDAQKLMTENERLVMQLNGINNPREASVDGMGFYDRKWVDSLIRDLDKERAEALTLKKDNCTKTARIEELELELRRCNQEYDALEMNKREPRWMKTRIEEMQQSLKTVTEANQKQLTRIMDLQKSLDRACEQRDQALNAIDDCNAEIKTPRRVIGIPKEETREELQQQLEVLMIKIRNQETQK